MQINENPDVSPSTVKEVMGHSQLSTTFIYTHANKKKNKKVISVFDKYYDNNIIKINFNQLLSLYDGINFAPTKEINELYKVIFHNTLVTEEEKIKLLKEHIERKYPIFKSLDISKLDINNVWDKLDEYKQKYGDEFLIQAL